MLFYIITWQSRVENERCSVTYFGRVTAFEMQASVNDGAQISAATIDATTHCV